jgi:hypothetical protein
MPKGVEGIKYEGISFHKKDTAGKTFAAFSEEQAHHGLSEEQLKEVWQLARGTKDETEVSKGLLESSAENNVVTEPVVNNAGGKGTPAKKGR